MALPQLKTLTYELNLPSTGETIKYRPFLVKEQKNLMIAQESEDEKMMETAFAQIINDCVLDDIDPYKMPVFDMEYVFLRIRGKSVGEKVTLNVLCPDDEKTRVNVELNLQEVDVQMKEEHTNVVQLTDDISMVMRYPCLGDVAGVGKVNTGTENIFRLIKTCIHEIHDGETVHHRVDMSETELDTFVESMSASNFESLTTFFDTMPKLQHAIEVKNPKTKKKGEVLVEGLESFFV